MALSSRERRKPPQGLRPLPGHHRPSFERDAPFAIEEFRTLNRCLDNAIADAVTEFSFQRDKSIARQQNGEANERIGFLVY